MSIITLKLGTHLPKTAVAAEATNNLFTLPQFPGLLFKRVSSHKELNSVSNIKLHCSYDGKVGMVISDSIARVADIPVDTGKISVRAVGGYTLVNASDDFVISLPAEWPGSTLGGNDIGSYGSGPQKYASPIPVADGGDVTDDPGVALGTFPTGVLYRALVQERAIGGPWFPSNVGGSQGVMPGNLAASAPAVWHKKRVSKLSTKTADGTASMNMEYTFAVVARADYAFLVGYNVLPGVVDGSWPTAGAPAVTNCAGYMSTVCPVGPLGPVIEAARGKLLNSVPSKIKKYAVAAYNELLVSMGGEQATLACVSYWKGTGLGTGDFGPVSGVAHGLMAACNVEGNSGAPSRVHLTSHCPSSLDPLCLPRLKVGTLPNIPFTTLQDIASAQLMGTTADFSLGYLIPNIKVGDGGSTWEEFMAPLNVPSRYTTLKLTDANPLYIPTIGDNDDRLPMASDLFGEYVSGNAVKLYLAFVKRFYALTESNAKSQ